MGLASVVAADGLDRHCTAPVTNSFRVDLWTSFRFPTRNSFFLFLSRAVTDGLTYLMIGLKADINVDRHVGRDILLSPRKKHALLRFTPHSWRTSIFNNGSFRQDTFGGPNSETDFFYGGEGGGRRYYTRFKKKDESVQMRDQITNDEQDKSGPISPFSIPTVLIRDNRKLELPLLNYFHITIWQFSR